MNRTVGLALVVGAIAVVGTIASVHPVIAQASLEKEPGYVDLKTIETWFGAEPFLFVNIKGALLNLVAEASRSDDPELYELLHRLKAVQVRGFKNESSNNSDVRRKVNGLARDLDARGWETVVRVREEDEQVDLFMKSNGESILGLMIMVVKADDDETVFVNVVGDIDPAQVGRLGRKFKIDELNRDW